MKGKKLLSWVLSAVLCLPALTGPALAASFPDVAGHWAVNYVDDTVAKGIFVGIEGNFVPERTITAGEVVATAARISVDVGLRKQIGADRQADIKAILGTTWVSSGKWDGEQWWFGDEYATCLESGILSYSELKELYQSKALVTPITKEDFALYLTRAMQMEPMAKNLSAYTLNFTDKKDITPGREPYIYVLNMCGVITGTHTGAFEPKKSVTRAEAAAMLSRATDFMEENGTSAELPQYAKYDQWVAGTIASATAGSKGAILLTLSSELSGTKTVSIPTETPIYENSMLADSSQLKAGAYARVNLGAGDKVISVRLSGTARTVSGTVVGISGDAIMLSVDGTTQTLGYDRFTEVQVGSAVGDRSLVDLDGGYTTAACRVDQLGHMVALRLIGGTRREEGIIRAVESAPGGVSLTVATLDGQLKKYVISSGAAITANGGLVMAPGSLNSSYVGSYAALRVNSENASAVVALELDTISAYLQGSVRNVNTSDGTRTVTITDLSTGKATTYYAAEDAEFYYQGKPVAHKNIAKDWFVTARLTSRSQGSELDALWCYPESGFTEGTVSAISYPSGTTNLVLTLAKADGAVVTFPLDMAGTLPEVKRSGKTSTLAAIRTGDLVKVTVRYNVVTLLEATPQTANLMGTISELTQTSSGITIKVELDGGWGSETYTVSRDVSVSQDGKSVSLYDLRVGYHVAMVSNGSQISSIEVDRATGNSGKISGTVILANSAERTITFRATELGMADRIVTVSVPSGMLIQDLSGGGASELSLNRLVSGDTLDIYGSGTGDQFKATLIIKR